jgi:glycosyltransferase involved in cell wall biosynthesis
MGNIRFLGHCSDEDLGILYRAAAGHLFLSRLEGFGLTVVEAMASSCPVIVASGSGSDEVAAEAALIVDPDDPREAAEAMRRIVGEPELRAQMVNKGHERAKLYERRAMARGYAESYMRALGR